MFSVDGINVADLTEFKKLQVRPRVVTLFGSGDFFWNSTSTTTANDVDVIQPTYGEDGLPTSGKAGRYKKVDPNGAINVAVKGALGDGVTDDTAAFNSAIAACNGHWLELDASKTYLVKDIVIPSNSGCSGIYCREGRTTVKPASGAISSTILFTVAKGDFYFRNIFFQLPYTGSGSTPPSCDRAIIFRNDSGSSRWEVTNCRFYGGKYGLTIGTVCDTVQIIGNEFDNIWGECLLVDSPIGGWIEDNIARGCAFDTTALASAAFRLNTSTLLQVPARLYFTRNIAYQCGLGNQQEGFDFSGAEILEITITENQAIECGNGGFEFKTFNSQASFTGTISGTTLTVSAVTGTIVKNQTVSGAGVTSGTKIVSGSGASWVVDTSQTVGPVAMTSVLTPDVYGKVLVSDNLVVMGGVATQGIGFSCHLSAAVAHTKAGLWQFSDNEVMTATMPSPGGSAYQGYIITDWTEVTISGGKLINLDDGISVQVNTASDNITGPVTITGVDINVGRFGIQAAGSTSKTISELKISNCPRILGATSPLSLAGPIISDLQVTHNYLGGGGALDIRNSTGALSYNTIVSSGNVVLQQSTTCAMVYLYNTVTGGSGLDAFSIGIGTAEIGFNRVIQARLVYAGAGTVSAYQNYRTPVSADPSGSPASVGDIFPNKSVTAGGVMGWVCTTAGVSSTCKSFGAISA